jgi:iron complex outermembrane receptor protein
LPFTPAPRLQSELKFASKKLSDALRNSYVSFGIEYDFDQNHVYSAYNTETPTPGYTLLNAAVGTDLYSKNHLLFSIYLISTNLTDVAYQNHLSRLKYAPENPATGNVGIYNMGRNFSIKVDIPIGIKG